MASELGRERGSPCWEQERKIYLSLRRLMILDRGPVPPEAEGQLTTRKANGTSLFVFNKNECPFITWEVRVAGMCKQKLSVTLM